jgi:hypothetical protein
VPLRWFDVPLRERALHRLVGVEIFGRMLERSGWNRRNAWLMQGLPLTKARLAWRAEAARGGIAAHGACFAVHVLLAGLALGTGHPWGAALLVAPGVILHLYPALLQRALLLRLEPLLRAEASRHRSG